MKKVQLLNEEGCRSDLSPDFDVINTIDAVKERLAEIPVDEFEEGESFYFTYCRNWSEYVPAGVFRLIQFNKETMEIEYEYIELDYV
ncbi:TPA: hypothetical protein ACSJUE_002291 [Listeria monocytogenes]|nr:hypothetical protein [Listeria monocytogenes]